jgi:hypothetical protein
LELPFTFGELQGVVEAAASSKDPDIDGLSYKFFFKGLVGMLPPFLFIFTLKEQTYNF